MRIDYSFLIAILVIPLFDPSVCRAEAPGARAAFVRTKVFQSENGRYLVRQTDGDGKGLDASLCVYRFDEDARTYLRFRCIELRNRRYPIQLFITNDGKYLVTLDETWEGVETPNAIVIYDLVENRSSAFALADFLPKESIADKLDVQQSDIPVRHPMKDKPLIRTFYQKNNLGHFWYQSAHLDDAKAMLYLSSAVRYRDIDLSYVIVNLSDMRIVLGEPPQPFRKNDDAEFLKRQEMEQKPLKSDLLDTTQFTDEKLSAEYRADAGAHIEAYGTSTEHESLLRIETGNNARSARSLVFRYEPESRTYNQVCDIELCNRVAPSRTILVQDARYLVTLDDVNQIGLTDNVVVIYDLRRNERKKYALKDFLQPMELGRLEQTQRGRIWRHLGSGSTIIDANRGWIFASGRPREGMNVPAVMIDVKNMTVSVDRSFHIPNARFRHNSEREQEK